MLNYYIYGSFKTPLINNASGKQHLEISSEFRERKQVDILTSFFFFFFFLRSRIAMSRSEGPHEKSVPATEIICTCLCFGSLCKLLESTCHTTTSDSWMEPQVICRIVAMCKQSSKLIDITRTWNSLKSILCIFPR